MSLVVTVKKTVCATIGHKWNEKIGSGMLFVGIPPHTAHCVRCGITGKSYNKLVAYA